jgi:anti-sigma B factor antagonist
MEMLVDELDGGVTSVALRGRLDTAGAGLIDLKFSVLAGARRALVVDLSGVSFLGSLGIRTLMVGAKTVASKGGKMVLLAPLPEVASVLKTARIDLLIPVLYERDAAIAAVSP